MPPKFRSHIPVQITTHIVNSFSCKNGEPARASTAFIINQYTGEQQGRAYRWLIVRTAVRSAAQKGSLGLLLAGKLGHHCMSLIISKLVEIDLVYVPASKLTWF